MIIVSHTAVSTHTRAFTLIEVLIALMIIAIALTAAVRTTHESIRATEHVRDVTIAHWVAMNVISEIQIGQLKPSNATDSLQGKSEMLNQTWSWSAFISENAFHLKRIVVQVKRHHYVITSVTGFYAP